MNNLKNMFKKRKLKNMPKVYYFNLDEETQRKNYMELQFAKYSIEYERVSQSNYTIKNINDWICKFEDSKLLLSLIDKEPECCIYPANFISHMEFMKDWLRKTNDSYLLVMEDDYDLSLIDYWHFTWNYLIANLPCDWEAFKLNDDNRDEIKFFIHPVNKCGLANFGATLFKREYVKKILNAYYTLEGKIKTPKKRSINNWSDDHSFYSYCVDSVLTRFGTVYTAPLITTEASLCDSIKTSDKDNSSKEMFLPIQHACHQWWRNEKHLFSLSDFFYYNKPNDSNMTIVINRNQKV